MPELMQMVPLDEIHPSPTNPRARMEPKALTELTDSVRRHGVMQPVLVRPIRSLTSGKLSSSFELVSGHRRFAASKAAGLTEIPATIRELSDLEALELQVVENLQRSDLHPLEEAEGYHALHKTHGISIDDVAAKVGKSKGYVYGRMALVRLPKSIKAKFLVGEITPSVALLFARMATPELAEKAFQEIAKDWRVRELGGITHAAAEAHLQQNYMLQLKNAPFDTADLTIVPAAGACAACPKRTGNQLELYSDVKSTDTCTDPKCFAAKRDAAWKRRTAEAKSSGQRVLSDEEARKADSGYGSNFTKLDQRCHEDPKNRTFRQIFAKAAMEVEPAIMRSPRDHSVIEVVPDDLVAKALKAAGVGRPSAHSTTQNNYAREAARKARLAKAAARAVVAAAMAKMSGASLEKLWPVIEAFALNRSMNDIAAAVAKSRGAVRKKVRHSYGMGLQTPGEALAAWISEQPKAAQAQLHRDVAFELMVTGAAPAMHSDKIGEELKAVEKAFGIKFEPIAEKARVAEKAAMKERRKPAPAKKASKSGSGKTRAPKASKRKVAQVELEDETDADGGE